MQPPFVRSRDEYSRPLSSAYMEHEAPVASRQLTKAGHRLAGLLNQIWP
jgi:hypothetical protein